MKLFITGDITADRKISIIVSKLKTHSLYRSGELDIIVDTVITPGRPYSMNEYIKYYRGIIEDIKSAQEVIAIPGKDSVFDSYCLLKIAIAKDNHVPVLVCDDADNISINIEKGIILEEFKRDLYSSDKKKIVFVGDYEYEDAIKDIVEHLSFLYDNFESHILLMNMFNYPDEIPLITKTIHGSNAVVAFIIGNNRSIPYCLKIASNMGIPIIYSSPFKNDNLIDCARNICDQLNAIHTCDELLKNRK